MSQPADRARPRRSHRRNFLQTSGAVVAAGAALGELSLSRSAHAAGSDVLRVGLVGCGGRGTGAAVQALQADPQTRLVAVADAFADAVESSLANLKKTGVADRVDVPKERQFVGFDSYQQVIDSGVDVVLLAAPPHFRPLHLEAAIKAGKHVFAEKPVAVDAPGVRRVLAACEEAKKKNLAVVSGLCWRYENTARASIEQIYSGAIGDVVAIHSTYNTPGRPKWPMLPRESGWSDMEWQLRNWYYFTWLSGDHIVEQAVHSVDKGQWALKEELPVSCVSLGGLQCRTEPNSGNIFDHHAVCYEYASGARQFFFTRQQPGTSGDVGCYVLGSKGVCTVERGRIEGRDGKNLWRYEGKKNVMHQTEHDEMYAALRSGRIPNDGYFMTMTTMVAILGRMASYTGQKVTWEQAFNSKEDLSPAKYQWGELATPGTAMPGVTRLV